AGVGHLRITAEDDGVARRMSLLVRHGATTLPSLALLAAAHSMHLAPDGLAVQGTPPALRLAGLQIPTDASAALRPRLHVAGPGDAPPFPVLSFASVVQGR